MTEYSLTSNELKARDRVVLALDVPSAEEARSYVRDLHDLVGKYKIGFELFTSEGPEIVRDVQREGGDTFLDLKFKDIPNTVKGAAKAATKLGVDMFNLHTLGGSEMMKAAVRGAEEAVSDYHVKKPKILGVTVLTSIDDRIMNEELRINGKVTDQVLHLAKLAEKSGLDGIVCSAADLHAVKDSLRKDFLYVTPGVQGITAKAGADQKRVFTPGNAIQDGSSFLVIGRAITYPNRTGKATLEEKRKSAYEILQDMAPHM
jgi:orotidine-5'-phosphate decarboxylase